MVVKTRPTGKTVSGFINAVKDPQKRKDCRALTEIMKAITKEKPIMWGTSIVGFGSYHYKYKSGREGDWLLTGFSPRARNLTVYIMPGFSRYEDLMSRLGPHKTGVSCLYIKTLSEIRMPVLRSLIRESVRYMKRAYSA